MLFRHISSIIEIPVNIVFPYERKRKYTMWHILKIAVLLKSFSISCRPTRKFPTIHDEYLRKTGLKTMPSFQTLSSRTSMVDLPCNEPRYIVPVFHEGICSCGFLHNPHLQIFHCIKEEGMGEAQRSRIWIIQNHERVVSWTQVSHDTWCGFPSDHGKEDHKSKTPWFPCIIWHGGFCKGFLSYFKRFRLRHLRHIWLCVWKHPFPSCD